MTEPRTLLTSPRTINVSTLPAPTAIEPLDFASLKAGFNERFMLAWNSERGADPTLPAYDTLELDSETIAATQQAWNFLRLLDRARVNDAVRAVLPAFSAGTDLDNLVAKQNIERLVVTPATEQTPAVMENDAALLRRYLASFDAPAAGSTDGYIFRAATAWPALHDCAVNGYAVHGRTGDIQIVVAGPGGRIPTADELTLVRGAVTAEDAKSAGMPVSVVAARRHEYVVQLHLRMIKGAEPSAVIATARGKVLTAANYLTRIGQEVPIWSVAGMAYSQNVNNVAVVEPVADIPADPNVIPVCTGVEITAEVRQ